MIEQSIGPASSTASATVLNTGTPNAFSPARPGVTPATTFVPYSIDLSVWNPPSRPVIPCTRTRVSALTRMLKKSPHVPTEGPPPGQHGPTLDPRSRSRAAHLIHPL